MIDSSAPTPDPEPAVAPDPEPQPAPEPVVAAPVDDDAAMDAIETNALEIPTGEKLVPLSALSAVRERLKEAKKGSAEAADLRTQLAQAQAQAAQLVPYAQAYETMRQAQQQAPPQPQPAQPAEDTSELEEVARVLDFWKPDGTVDLDKARKHQGLVERQATKIAQRAMAPLVRQHVNTAAQQNIALAKATKNPDTGKPLDPAVIDAVVNRIASQPGGDETLADREQMKMLWVVAKGLSPAQAAAAVAEPSAVVTPAAAPVVTERSGGRNASQPTALSAAEKRAAKDAGLTEKAYLEIAKGMPW